MRGIFELALTALLIFPSWAISQDQVPDSDIQMEWHDVQTKADRAERRDWWRRLDTDRLSTYIDAGADVNVADRRRWTPLHSAARHNSDPEIVLALLRAGAVVDARNKSGDTPLHWAAAENHKVEILNALIDAGAHVNARDKFGWLPIHTAAESNPNSEIIDALLKAGSKRNKRAYYVLFRPRFLLKHNSRMSKSGKKIAMELLKEADREPDQS